MRLFLAQEQSCLYLTGCLRLHPGPMCWTPETKLSSDLVNLAPRTPTAPSSDWGLWSAGQGATSGRWPCRWAVCAQPSWGLGGCGLCREEGVWTQGSARLRTSCAAQPTVLHSEGHTPSCCLCSDLGHQRLKPSQELCCHPGAGALCLSCRRGSLPSSLLPEAQSWRIRAVCDALLSATPEAGLESWTFLLPPEGSSRAGQALA